MKLHVPLLWPTSGTPPVAPGLQLCSGEPTGILDDRGAWLHGALVVAEEEPPATVAAWLAGLRLFAISATEPAAQVGRLLHQPTLLRPPPWELVAVGPRPQRRLCFTTHTAWLFSRPWADDQHHVHAAAGLHLSRPLLLVGQAAATPTPARARPVAPRPSPGDLLLRAYDLALHEQTAEAVAAFATALELPEVAQDPDGAHRYNAACVALRAADLARRDAAATLDPDQLEEQALRWLSEDLALRCAIHADHLFDLALAGLTEDPPPVGRDLLVSHVDLLRTDPDLAPLRADGRLAHLLRTCRNSALPAAPTGLAPQP